MGVPFVYYYLWWALDRYFWSLHACVSFPAHILPTATNIQTGAVVVLEPED